MLRIWNVTLVIVTFFLTIFGTFMTRSGVVQSVHAFGEDPILAKLFTVFMVLDPGRAASAWSSIGCRCCGRATTLDSWVSREAAFLVNNWILLFSAFFVLFATMFPTLSEAVTGRALTVGPPFFNKWMLPIGLVLLFLTGIGPLLAWRKSTIANLRDQFLFPVVCRGRDGRRSCGVRRPGVGVRHLLRAVRLRERHDSSGVRPRCERQAWRHRHRHSDGADWSRQPEQAPLRRLHRSRRHRADLPWFRG